MTTLYGRTPKDTFPSLLKFARPQDATSGGAVAGLGSDLRAIEDGLGNGTLLALSTTSISLNGSVWPQDTASPDMLLAMGNAGQLVWKLAGDILPPISGQGGKFLKTDGSTISWASAPTGGSTEAQPDSATYTYDDNQNVKTITEVVQGSNRITTLTYNDDGTVSSLAVAYQGSTRTETYTYNLFGKLSGMTATTI